MTKNTTSLIGVPFTILGAVITIAGDYEATKYFGTYMIIFGFLMTIWIVGANIKD